MLGINALAQKPHFLPSLCPTGCAQLHPSIAGIPYLPPSHLALWEQREPQGQAVLTTGPAALGARHVCLAAMWRTASHQHLLS